MKTMLKCAVFRLRGPRGLSWLALVLLIGGCTSGGVPDGVETVERFELERYLGTWYEIARLDHRFERGLEDVTATYTLKDDGSVRVVNRGRSRESGEWDVAEGRARFAGARDEGRLEVSFFGPFYGAYNIIALDRDDYAWSMVSGPNRDYLWILSRTPELPAATRSALLDRARKDGFPVEELIWVDHAAAVDR